MASGHFTAVFNDDVGESSRFLLPFRTGLSACAAASSGCCSSWEPPDRNEQSAAGSHPRKGFSCGWNLPQWNRLKWLWTVQAGKQDLKGNVGGPNSKRWQYCLLLSNIILFQQNWKTRDKLESLAIQMPTELRVMINQLLISVFLISSEVVCKVILFTCEKHICEVSLCILSIALHPLAHNKTSSPILRRLLQVLSALLYDALL